MKYLFISFIFLTGCSIAEEPLTAQQVIDSAIEAHGLNLLEGKKLAFSFRDKQYSLFKENERYTYTRSFQDSLGYVEDVLVNSSDFKRFIDNKEFALDEEWSGKYANSVNSVLYFIQLPLPLNDPAVIKKYLGPTKLKGNDYHLVEIRFEEEDGGKDFEDVFLYWFDLETFTLDYLAYSYITDGGGVRFREVINRREVDGIMFQDYINFKPDVKTTPLREIAALFEKDELIELSRIENYDIQIN